jgi:L-asparaginase
VVEAYSYPGSAKSMQGSGLIFADDITGPKARIKLMLALGLTNDVEEIAKFFK